MSKKNNLFRLLGIIFLFFSFYSAFKYGENYKEFLFIITICIFTDIGGYIFGKIFNGPKLTKISPKKTYAGVFGGFILSLVTGFVFWYYVVVWDANDAININTWMDGWMDEWMDGWMVGWVAVNVN